LTDEGFNITLDDRYRSGRLARRSRGRDRAAAGAADADTDHDFPAADDCYAAADDHFAAAYEHCGDRAAARGASARSVGSIRGEEGVE
jgi:hypothetical protein